MASVIDSCEPRNGSEQPDFREALFNSGQVGPIEHVQVSTARIVQLRGILFDLDPHLYRESAILPKLPSDPEEFYRDIASHWLSRHPVLDKAQVRNSGTGLHAILFLNEPLVFNSDAERERWAGIIQVVQAAMPWTLISRASQRQLDLWAVQTRRTALKSLLKEGLPVTAEEILGSISGHAQ